MWRYVTFFLLLLSFCYGDSDIQQRVKTMMDEYKKNYDWKKLNEVIAQMGEEAVPFILEEGKDIDYYFLAEILSCMGKKSEQTLLTMLKFADQTQQRKAIMFVLMFLHSEEAIPKILKYRYYSLE